jgi:hypothetical protein
MANLNCPSFVVVFHSSTDGVRKLTRTLAKVLAKPETYNVTFVAPEGVAVTVTPTTLEFSIEAQGKVRPAGTWDGTSATFPGRTGSTGSGAPSTGRSEI